MPFQSEKQRRYLWANEPEIAREWTDRYGARGGGIMDIASDGNLIHDFENYKKGNSVNVPTSFQARSHSTPVNLAYITDEEAGILQALKPDTPHEGPMGIPNYDDYSPTGGYRSGAAMSAAETGSTSATGKADMAAAGMSAQEIAGIRGGAIAAGAQRTAQDDINEFNRSQWKERFTPFNQRTTHKSGFFGGLNNMVGRLRGWNPITNDWNTQQQYEDARTKRQNRSRIDRLRKTRDYGKYANDPQGWAASDLSGRLTGLEKDVFGKGYVDYSRTTPKARDLKALRDKQALTSQLSTPKRSLGQIVMDARRKSPVNLDPGWSAHKNMTHANAPQSIKDFYTNAFKSRYDDQGLASFGDPWAGPQIQQVGWNTTQKGMVESLKDLGFSAKDAYERLSNKNKSKGLVFKDYTDPLQPEEFYDKWYGGSFDQLPSNKKGYEVPQDVDTQIQNIYKDYI